MHTLHATGKEWPTNGVLNARYIYRMIICVQESRKLYIRPYFLFKKTGFTTVYAVINPPNERSVAFTKIWIQLFRYVSKGI
jgi:hypothetical protein